MVARNTAKHKVNRFHGLSTEPKPGSMEAQRAGEALGDAAIATEGNVKPLLDSIFVETDTGDRYIWDGEIWVRHNQTIEFLLEQLIEGNARIAEHLEVLVAGQKEYLSQLGIELDEL